MPEVPVIGNVPDLLADSKLYEWAGIGFGEQETYRLMQSLKVMNWKISYSHLYRNLQLTLRLHKSDSLARSVVLRRTTMLLKEFWRLRKRKLRDSLILKLEAQESISMCIGWLTTCWTIGLSYQIWLQLISRHPAPPRLSLLEIVTGRFTRTPTSSAKKSTIWGLKSPE